MNSESNTTLSALPQFAGVAFATLYARVPGLNINLYTESIASVVTNILVHHNLKPQDPINRRIVRGLIFRTMDRHLIRFGIDPGVINDPRSFLFVYRPVNGELLSAFLQPQKIFRCHTHLHACFRANSTRYPMLQQHTMLAINALKGKDLAAPAVNPFTSMSDAALKEESKEPAKFYPVSIPVSSMWTHSPPGSYLMMPVEKLAPPVEKLAPPVAQLDPHVAQLDPPVVQLDPHVAQLDPPVLALAQLAPPVEKLAQPPKFEPIPENKGNIQVRVRAATATPSREFTKNWWKGLNGKPTEEVRKTVFDALSKMQACNDRISQEVMKVMHLMDSDADNAPMFVACRNPSQFKPVNQSSQDVRNSPKEDSGARSPNWRNKSQKKMNHGRYNSGTRRNRNRSKSDTYTPPKQSM
jgi:hypothetical protein